MESSKDHCQVFFPQLNLVEDIIFKIGFLSLVVGLSILGGFLFFLVIVSNRKLRNTFRCHFLLLFLCDVTVAILFVIDDTFYVFIQIKKSISLHNVLVKLYPSMTVLEAACSSVSDFLLTSATVEVLVQILKKNSHKETAIARWFGIGFSIAFGIAIQYPLFNMFTFTFSTELCDGAIYLIHDSSAHIFRVFWHPLLTTIVPLFIEAVLLAVLGRQVKIQSESAHQFKFLFPLLCAMTFARVVPDVVSKIHYILLKLTPHDSHIHDLYQYTVVFVQFAKLLSYVALIYFDQDFRKGLRNIKVVRLLVTFVDGVQKNIPRCSALSGWRRIDDEDCGSQLLESFGTELHSVSSVTQL